MDIFTETASKYDGQILEIILNLLSEEAQIDRQDIAKS